MAGSGAQELLVCKWENFTKVIDKAKISCKNAGFERSDHFPDIRKMVKLGMGTVREVDDIALTRYACYLIAQNGDPSKDPIAFAQTYFAVQTRKQEIIEQRIAEVERLNARKKLTLSEKELSELSMSVSAIRRVSAVFAAGEIRHSSEKQPSK